MQGSIVGLTKGRGILGVKIIGTFMDFRVWDGFPIQEPDGPIRSDENIDKDYTIR